MQSINVWLLCGLCFCVAGLSLFGFVHTERFYSHPLCLQKVKGDTAIVQNAEIATEQGSFHVGRMRFSSLHARQSAWIRNRCWIPQKGASASELSGLGQHLEVSFEASVFCY